MRARDAQKLKSQIEEYDEIRDDLGSRHETLTEIVREVDDLKDKKRLKYDRVLCAAWKETQKQLARAEGALYLFTDILEQRVDANTEELDEADAWDQ